MKAGDAEHLRKASVVTGLSLFGMTLVPVLVVLGSDCETVGLLSAALAVGLFILVNVLWFTRGE